MDKELNNINILVTLIIIMSLAVIGRRLSIIVKKIKRKKAAERWEEIIQELSQR